MTALEIICAIVLIAAAVVITLLVAVQNPNNNAMAALSGNSFGNIGKARSLDAKINKLLKILVIAFFVLAVVVFAVTLYL